MVDMDLVASLDSDAVRDPLRLPLVTAARLRVLDHHEGSPLFLDWEVSLG
jgi:hypothetical protein